MMCFWPNMRKSVLRSSILYVFSNFVCVGYIDNALGRKRGFTVLNLVSSKSHLPQICFKHNLTTFRSRWSFFSIVEHRRRFHQNVLYMCMSHVYVCMCVYAKWFIYLLIFLHKLVRKLCIFEIIDIVITNDLLWIRNQKAEMKLHFFVVLLQFWN